MNLKNYLMQFTKPELTENCRFFGLKGYSSLKKEQMADKLVGHICSSEVMPNYLSAFTPQQKAFLEKGTAENGVLFEPGASNQVEDLDRLYYGYMDEEEGVFHTYEEIAQAIQENQAAADAKNSDKKAWLMKCLYIFTRYYGLGSVEVLYDLYKQKSSDSIEEMMTLMSEIPAAMSEMIFLSKEQCQEISKALDEGIKTEYGAYVYYEFFEASAMHDLISKQKGRFYFAPSPERIEEMYDKGYEPSSPDIKKMEASLIKDAHASEQDAKDFAQILANLAYLNEPVSVFMELLQEMYPLSKEEEVNVRFAALNVIENTPTLENRGASAADVRAIFEENILFEDQLFPSKKDVKPVEISKDYYRDASTGALKNKQKIGPNDPCPCGSGKKYKKCCGRKGKRA
jgi:uncharacterized protein YchJ